MFGVSLENLYSMKLVNCFLTIIEIRLALKQTGFCLHGNQKHGTNISHHSGILKTEMLTFKLLKASQTWLLGMFCN